jgi:hypothetical protein
VAATSRDRQAELTRRADLLSALLRNPSWQFFEQEIDRKIERLKRTAMNLALLETGADQRKLDTVRGTIAALNWIRGVPHNAQSTLEAFLREQGLTDEEIWKEE